MAVPDLSGAFLGWTSPLIGYKLFKELNRDGIIEWTKAQIKFNGNLQPTSEKLMSDSRREWANAEWTLYVPEISPIFNLDDIVYFSKSFFQVKIIEDWSSSGFVRYGLTRKHDISVEDLETMLLAQESSASGTEGQIWLQAQN